MSAYGKLATAIPLLIENTHIQDLVSNIPEPTPEQIAIGIKAVDEYYDGTKDAPWEGSLALAYRAMKALEIEDGDGKSRLTPTTHGHPEEF